MSDLTHAKPLYEAMRICLISYSLVQALLKQSQHFVHASLHLVKASQEAPSLAGFRPLFCFTPAGCSYHAEACTILALRLPFHGMIQACGIVMLLRQSLTSRHTCHDLMLLAIKTALISHGQSSGCKQTSVPPCW